MRNWIVRFATGAGLFGGFVVALLLAYAGGSLAMVYGTQWLSTLTGFNEGACAAALCILLVSAICGIVWANFVDGGDA